MTNNSNTTSTSLSSGVSDALDTPRESKALKGSGAHNLFVTPNSPDAVDASSNSFEKPLPDESASALAGFGAPATFAGASPATSAPTAPATNEAALEDYYSLQNYETKIHANRTKFSHIVVLLVFAALIAFGGYQLYEYVRPPVIDAYANEAVELVGLSDESLFITPAELSELSCKTVSATGTSDKIGQGTVVEKQAVGYGPSLEEVVNQFGYTLSDFRRIVFQCKDGYETAILPNTTLDGDAYLLITRGKDALPEEMQPMRLLMPDMPTGQWVYGIETISFELAQ